MAKLQEVREYKKDGSSFVKGYRISLQKTKVDETGFTKDDELKIEYEKDKIIITK